MAIKAMGAFIVDLEARRARARRGRGVEPVEKERVRGRHWRKEQLPTRDGLTIARQ